LVTSIHETTPFRYRWRHETTLFRYVWRHMCNDVTSVFSICSAVRVVYVCNGMYVYVYV